MDNSIQGTVIGLDVGERRIGVARVHPIVKIAEPLAVINTADGDQYEAVQAVIAEHQADGVVVGLPRGLDGQETAQTAYCRNFARELKEHVAVPVYLIDEAGSSKEADERLKVNPGASRDSVAAAVFLEDFIVDKNQQSLLL